MLKITDQFWCLYTKFRLLKVNDFVMDVYTMDTMEHESQ